MKQLPPTLAFGTRVGLGLGLPEAGSSLLRNIFRREKCAEEARVEHK